MSNRRARALVSNVILFPIPPSPSSRPRSLPIKLDSVKCKPVRASLRTSPPVAVKAARLHAVAPELSKIVEDLIDEVLEDVS